MSIIANARQRQVEQARQQEFVPVREGLGGYYGDEAGYREAHAIMPIVGTPQQGIPSSPRLPNRILSPEQTRALQAQEEMEMARQMQIRQGTMNEVNRPQYIGR